MPFAGLTASAEPQNTSYPVAEHFLRKYMPLRDRFQLSEDFIANNIHAALSARNDSRWGPTIPHTIFHNYILPYARQASSFIYSLVEGGGGVTTSYM